MGVVAEIVEGVLNCLVNIFNSKKEKKNNRWEKMEQVNVPRWVEKASHKFHKKYPVKNHDLRKDFVGKHYVYRVFYRKWAHGRVKEDFYRRKR